MLGMILCFVEQGIYFDVKKGIVNLNVVYIVQLFEEIVQNRLFIIFTILPSEIASSVYFYMPDGFQGFFKESVTDRETIRIIGKPFLEDTFVLLEEMPINIVKRLPENTKEKSLELINQPFNYSKYSTDSLLIIKYVMCVIFINAHDDKERKIIENLQKMAALHPSKKACLKTMSWLQI